MSESRKNSIAVILIFITGLLARTVFFGSIPGGLNQDEAFAAYDAWSMMTAGVDSAGYRFPVYLTAWGSGMNALESYLMIPFFAIFGTSDWVVRLPQLMVALLSLLAVYDMTKRMAGRELALCFMAMTAICPWHIMLSRWALESNLAPGFILFGLCFFVRGLENSKWMLLSAVMYGLSLYCYATIWPIVPLILLMQLVYCRKNLRLDRYSVLSVALLGIIAMPLLLFVAVNYGHMEEIRTSFISIPKLLVMRSDEISASNILGNIKNTMRVLLRQTDGTVWNGAGELGILYKASLPMLLLGLCISVKTIKENKKTPCLDGLMLIWLAGAVLLGMMVEVNVNRINIIFLPLIYFISKGFLQLLQHFGKLAKLLLPALYTVLFACFLYNYFTVFPDAVKHHFNDGLGSALEAVENREGDVYLDPTIFHSQVMFYTKTEQKEFAETVEYMVYPATYLHAKSFGRYTFGVDVSNPDSTANYVVRNPNDVEVLKQLGYTTENHGIFVLAYK